MRVGSGTIYAHVFENLSAGIPRNLFWNLGIDLGLSSEEVADQIQSISCSWMTLAPRRWRDLDGLSLSDCLQPSIIECTFYRDSEHHWADLDAFSLRCTKEVGHLDMVLSLHTPSVTVDNESAIRMNVECEAIFDGIIVVPGNLKPSPTTPEEAIKVASEFADIGAFQEPIWDRFRYIFRPAL